MLEDNEVEMDGLNEQIRNPFTAARREALMLTSLALSDFRNRVKLA